MSRGGTQSSAQRERLASLIEPVVAARGYDLEDVTVAMAGRRSVVKVIVDSDQGVGLDDVAAVSRAISAVLDENDDSMGRSPYVLEVTSPGVDRPLTEPRHWRRSVGRLVQLEIADAPAVVGRIVETDATGVELDVEDERRRIEFGAVRQARVQVEFNRPEGGRR
ncbi:MAG TPA: ribosome maturation factor RimP [Mycobacteriales bacterium]|jgi:ribosome maturation factor RimP|nr:ribosome maturation factor RimP [Mycobacteriales bacterium]